MRAILSVLVSILCVVYNVVCAQNYYVAKIAFEETRGKIIVPVTINGVQGKFLFDTGAPVCVTEKFASLTGIKALSTNKFEDSNGQVITNSVTIIEKIDLGGVQFSRVESVILGNENPVNQFGIDGIIGYTLFGASIVGIDYKEKQITITNSHEIAGINSMGVPTPLLPGQFVPVMSVNIGKNAVDTVMFDSGASEIYKPSVAAFTRLKNEDGALNVLQKGRGFTSMGAAGVEQASEKYRLNISSLTIGEATFANLITENNSGSISRIGSGLLRFGTVVIDYITKNFYYKPHIQSPIQVPPRPEWDVVITALNDELIIGFVWGEEKQKKANIGDKIVEINGIAYDKVDTYKAITTNLINLSGSEADIVVQDRKTGELHKMKIRKL